MYRASPAREKKKDFPAEGTLVPGRKVLLPLYGRAPPDSCNGIGMLTVQLTTTPFSTRNYTMDTGEMQEFFGRNRDLFSPWSVFSIGKKRSMESPEVK